MFSPVPRRFRSGIHHVLKFHSLQKLVAQARVKRANIFLIHFERRRLAEKAVIWGAVVAIFGIAVDYGTWRFHWPWLREHVVVNVIQGSLFALFAWLFFKARLQRRFKEVGYLNHHIRNSLATINLAEVIPESDERMQMVAQATIRIQRCVEKITREEDCEIDERFPSEP